MSELRSTQLGRFSTEHKLSLLECLLLLDIHKPSCCRTLRKAITMAHSHAMTATPFDYETGPEDNNTTDAAQQLAQQPVRLFSPVPNPETATATNMVAQRNLLPAVPGGPKQHRGKGGKATRSLTQPVGNTHADDGQRRRHLSVARTYHLLAPAATQAQPAKPTTQQHPRSPGFARRQLQAARRTGNGHRK